MSNLEILIPFIDGSMCFLHEPNESCKEAIHALIGDDFGAPPINIIVRVKTKSGKIIELSIPYDDEQSALVTIDSEII